MRHMPIRFLLAAIFLFAVGCNDNASIMDADSGEPAIARLSLSTGTCPVGTPIPGAVWPSIEFLDTLEYEEFSGTLMPGIGAALFGTMSTWPKNCTFSLVIPPEALPASITQPTTFSMRIPTQQSYDDNVSMELPLIIRLEPSDITFEAPIRVNGTYMPWRTFDSGGLWTVQPEYEAYPNVGSFVTPQGKTRIFFDACHFSDWNICGECIPEIGPGIPGLD